MRTLEAEHYGNSQVVSRKNIGSCSSTALGLFISYKAFADDSLWMIHRLHCEMVQVKVDDGAEEVLRGRRSNG
jgi:hypothetical protein